MVSIFDECHLRSPFGDNHKAIKEFFPKGSALFRFYRYTHLREQTLPISSASKAIFKRLRPLRTSSRSFYTTVPRSPNHTAEGQNVLRFHLSTTTSPTARAMRPSPGAGAIARRAIVDAILTWHDAATERAQVQRRWLRPPGINDAIEYYDIFELAQAERQQCGPELCPRSTSPPSTPSPPARRQH